MRLKTYLSDEKITIPAFADRIGVTVQAAHRYVRGERIPLLSIMDRITAETNGKVQPNDMIAQKREAAPKEVAA